LRPSSPETTRGYPGNKGRDGVWQQIIAQIPPHDLYVEAFAGSAQVLLHKRPAASSIAVESDAAVASALASTIARRADMAGVIVVWNDAVRWLEKHRGEFKQRTVVYCDPPYLGSVRSNPRRRYYAHELSEEALHVELLAVLSRLTTQGVFCLLSGYRSELYNAQLGHWRRVDYPTMTRGGPRTESLWCNFEQPAELHDYRPLGRNFRERERIKRKKQRWVRRLAGMDALERAAVIAAIDEYRDIASPRAASGPVQDLSPHTARAAAIATNGERSRNPKRPPPSGQARAENVA